MNKTNITKDSRNLFDISLVDIFNKIQIQIDNVLRIVSLRFLTEIVHCLTFMKKRS